jgi:Fe-S-cluster containining protein
VTPLPLADPCGGCGRCCEHIGLPPFEAANPLFGPQPVRTAGLTDTQIADAVFDTELLLAMPAELQEAHAALVLELVHDPSGRPCAWYDTTAKRCRHHAWRPATCRRFWANDGRCNELRADPRAVLHWGDDTSVGAWRNPRAVVPRG